MSHRIPFLITNTGKFEVYEKENHKVTCTCGSELFDTFTDAVDAINESSTDTSIPVLRSCKGFKVRRYLTQDEEILDEVLLTGIVISKHVLEIFHECKNKNFRIPIDYANFLIDRGLEIDINNHMRIKDIIDFIKAFDFTFFDPKNVFVDRWNKFVYQKLDSK
jgi:hypothetical protein